MKQYDAPCPLCGTVNKDMFLEETDGWMECEHCHATVQVMHFEKVKKIPVYSMKEAGLIFGTKEKAAAVNQ